jgi:hypothetical protein
MRNILEILMALAVIALLSFLLWIGGGSDLPELEQPIWLETIASGGVVAVLYAVYYLAAELWWEYVDAKEEET